MEKWKAFHATNRIMNARLGALRPEKISLPYLFKLESELMNWLASVRLVIQERIDEEESRRKAALS